MNRDTSTSEMTGCRLVPPINSVNKPSSTNSPPRTNRATQSGPGNPMSARNASEVARQERRGLPDRTRTSDTIRDFPPNRPMSAQIPSPPAQVAFPMYAPPTYMYSAIPTVYGQVQPHNIPGSIVVYLSSPLPAQISSIILVPPTSEPLLPTATPTEDACSSAEGSSPLTVLIERNVFKQWLDHNVPESLTRFPRLKRYKSVETFMHWITAKKKHWEVPITILIRVTEVRNLLSELRKEFSPSVISQKILRNVFAYEHLFSLSSDSAQNVSGGKSTSRSTAPPVSLTEEGINLSHSLDDACKAALSTVGGL